MASVSKLRNMRGIHVAVSATFTAEPLREPMEFLFRLLGWERVIEFAPFAQVIQTLLDPAGLFAGNAKGVNVVLIRAEEWEDAEWRRDFVEAARAASDNHDAELLIHVCPSRGVQSEPSLIAIESTGRATLLTEADRERRYPVAEIYDDRAFAVGAIPYSEEYFAGLAAHLTRATHRLRFPPIKVIALDCDDTLWAGVCGEDGPAQVVIDEPRLALQQFMKSQREHGRLLAIASKNNQRDVEETFRAHPEMPLQWESFAAGQIHWQGKAESLQAIAEELNLGLDSFVFVDDNPKETAEVAAELPEVTALVLPADPRAIPEFLEHVWVFDAPLVVTAEDTNRARDYMQQSERGKWERQARNLEEFLAGLQLEVAIEPIEERHVARAAQLTQRTNQMNFTTRRRTEAELRFFMRTGWGAMVSVKDRFGDSGVVGLMLFRRGSEALVLDTFLLSCRALGRGVEHRMLRYVGERALAEGREVEIEFERTERNLAAEEFLEGVRDRSAQGLARLVFEPSNGRRHAVVERKPGILSARAADYQTIAELRDAGDLMRAVRQERRVAVSPTRLGSGETPRTDLEKRLCALWSELLGTGAVGVHDNFFDLGGHSLLAVQLVARLQRDLGIELPLEAVYTGTLTVAELARSIELVELGGMDESEYAAVLAEIENLSDEEAEALLARELNVEAQL